MKSSLGSFIFTAIVAVLLFCFLWNCFPSTHAAPDRLRVILTEQFRDLPSWSLGSNKPVPIPVETAMNNVRMKLKNESHGSVVLSALLQPHFEDTVQSEINYRYWTVTAAIVPITGSGLKMEYHFLVAFNGEVFEVKEDGSVKSAE